MKTKKIKFIYGIIFILISNNVLAQENIKINLEALKVFNSYLINKSVIDDVKAELTFNSYSNSLDYKSTTLFYENPLTEKDIAFKLVITFSIPIDDLNSIEEIFASKNETTIVQYKFNLNKEVKFVSESKEKGKFLDKEILYLKELSISPAINTDSKDLNNIKKAIRDVFTNANFKTTNIQY